MGTASPSRKTEAEVAGFQASPARREALQRVLVDLIELHLQGKQAHWNVRGSNFIAIHELLDTLVANAQASADLAAEREKGWKAHAANLSLAEDNNTLREALREAGDKLQPIAALVDMTPTGFPDHDICPIRLGMARELRELRAEIDALLAGETQKENDDES